MRIRNWLMISYLIVMLLPLVALYLLYVSVSNYDQKRDLLEYMEVTMTVDAMEPVLENPTYYRIQPRQHYEDIDKLTDETMKIKLYRFDGVLLYSSIQEPVASRLTKLNQEQLYQDVNQIQKNLSTYTVKRPVLHQGGQLTGFYEVTINREEWLQGIKERTVWIGGGLMVFIVIVFLAVIYLLNRKLNRPLLTLQRQMTAFAEGEIIPGTRPARDEIGELQTHFYTMKEKIKKSQEEIVQQQKEKEFILAALSHDLKTPLTVIQAYSEGLMSDRPLTDQESREYKAILVEKLAYMKQLIDDLAIYASLQASHDQTGIVEVDGEEFFEMLLSGYEKPCMKKGIQLRIDQRAFGTYHVNVKQMIRVLDNLVANAIRHTDEGDMILLAALSQDQPLPEEIFPPIREALEAWRNGGTVMIIQNEGTNIPEQMLERMLLPFVQGEESRGSGSSGLGLSIAKMLMERHEGHIRLWSEEGCGTIAACWIKER
ncbi:hypothetical protein JCM10914A_03570 [Paenibacillus sp. JCM 10914]|uniref:HAMP domain-containing sensor histidine kinase n=1 Tax=Paenibacillus sp. JCM 10914 TaxID=1236974 RepID=UPI0003CCA8FC|nr:HAMP domain-containing sensor histidine kinase [Paenibacillus sp. JCM 10914]GAE07967.1 two-component sensor histidine kinase [Paenibacillus sp. JCM 10914]